MTSINDTICRSSNIHLTKIIYMSKREAISRYHLIINKLKRYPATFEEIEAHLYLESEIQGWNFSISKRTFQRDRRDIEMIYSIEIKLNPYTKKYFIVDNVLPEVSERMLEAFDTFNALNIADRLSQNIHFEDRRPQGTEHLYGLLHAMNNTLEISFVYQKYWEDGTTQRVLKPYALKEFKNRWYLLGEDKKDSAMKTFALDRISEFQVSKSTFERNEAFSVKNYFRNCFGIITPAVDNPVNVILSFTVLQGKYIKSLPIHHSQELLVDNETEVRIKLYLNVTHDFEMEVFSYGAAVKIIEPQSLINERNHQFEEVLNLQAL